MAQALYKDMTGEFARAAWDRVVPVEPSPEVISKIRALRIRYAKGREAAARREGAAA